MYCLTAANKTRPTRTGIEINRRPQASFLLDSSKTTLLVEACNVVAHHNGRSEADSYHFYMQ